MIEDVFPIARSAMSQSISIAGMALGWHGTPRQDPGAFEMTDQSISALRAIVEAGSVISVRDDVTQGIAKKFGIETVMTGCSAWYSIPDLHKSPTATHPEPKTIVFTTPAQAKNAREAISVMQLVRQRFPNAKVIASFHRGIGRDQYTRLRPSLALKAQARAAERLGFEVRDVSYDLSKIGFYRDVDLHLGYRVHAHLDFVSRRVPSLLISEDGRGYGQTESLHGEEHVLWAGNADLIEKFNDTLSREIEANWPSLNRAVETIESKYPVMEQVISGTGGSS